MINSFKKFTIDASVFAKIFINETLSDRALELVLSIQRNNHIIINPSLFEYELIRVAITNGVDLDVFNRTLTDYKKTNLILLSPNSHHIKRAKKMIDTCRTKNISISFYDAIYHAIALEEEAIFITADEKYYFKTNHFGNINLLTEDLEGLK